MADLRHEPESEAPRDEGEVLKIVRFDDIHDSPPEMRPLKLDEMEVQVDPLAEQLTVSPAYAARTR